MYTMMYIYGILSTFSSLTLASGNVAINNLFYIGFIVAVIIKYKRIRISRNTANIIWMMLLFEFFLSSFLAIGKNYELGRESLIISTKYIVYFLSILLFIPKSKYAALLSCFLRGLYISCIIQAFWAVIQYIVYHLFYIFINEIFFNNTIIGGHSYTRLWNGGFRATGLSWEPANLVICMIVGLMLTSNKYLKILFAFVILISGSRTGAVLLIGMMLAYFIYDVSVSKSIVLKKKHIISIFSAMFFVLLIVFVVRRNTTFYVSVITNLDRIGSVLSGGADASSSRHIEYYIRYFELFKKNNFIENIFGVGTFIAGNQISKLLNIYSYLGGSSWNPESDIITVLVGNGMLGFMLYISIFAVGIRRSISYKNRKLFITFTCMFLGGVTYLYIRSTWFVLLLLLISLATSSKKTSDEFDKIGYVKK